MMVNGIGVENRLGSEVDVHLERKVSGDGKVLLLVVVQRKGDPRGVIEVAQPSSLNFTGPIRLATREFGN